MNTRDWTDEYEPIFLQKVQSLFTKKANTPQYIVARASKKEHNWDGMLTSLKISHVKENGNNQIQINIPFWEYASYNESVKDGYWDVKEKAENLALEWTLNNCMLNTRTGQWHKRGYNTETGEPTPYYVTFATEEAAKSCIRQLKDDKLNHKTRVQVCVFGTGSNETLLYAIKGDCLCLVRK